MWQMIIHANIHTYRQFIVANYPNLRIYLDCGSKLEYLKGTKNIAYFKTTQKHKAGFKLMSNQICT